MDLEVGSTVASKCPSCGTVAERTTYDVGSGPELSCASCEWCWGANGQDLQPLDLGMMQQLRDSWPKGQAQ